MQLNVPSSQVPYHLKLSTSLPHNFENAVGGVRLPEGRKEEERREGKKSLKSSDLLLSGADKCT